MDNQAVSNALNNVGAILDSQTTFQGLKQAAQISQDMQTLRIFTGSAKMPEPPADKKANKKA